MDLRSMVNSSVQVINEDIESDYYESTGYTVDESFNQVPSYNGPIPVMLQVQALDKQALKHIDGLNIQGTFRQFYISEIVQGVNRIESKGGDKFIIGCQTWLVTKVLETWPSWSKVVGVLQVDDAVN